jgi:Tol biopolymer transport system component
MSNLPLCLLLTVPLGLLVPIAADAQPRTTRVSVGSGGVEANRISVGQSLSADGRWVAFDSRANNLVPNDTNEAFDVFVHDRHTGTTTRVSLGPGGVEGNDSSSNATISGDGRYVVFESSASNLVGDDTNAVRDIFVHDGQSGLTTRVSAADGEQFNAESRAPVISADGRWVAFGSLASNLVPDDTNDVYDTFLHDRQTGTIIRVSVGPGGVQGNQSSGEPSISADGRWVAFTSLASNLVGGDTNGVSDTFVYDRLTAATSRVNVGPGGLQANDHSYWWPAISADGTRVAFQSAASNLVAGDTNGVQDIFVHDMMTGTTTCVSVGPGNAFGNGASEFPAISADGRWVTFDSSATTLVQDDSNGFDDVFVRDLTAGTVTRVSVGAAEVQGDQHSVQAAISADGRWIAFASAAGNLVAGDSNGLSDIFARDRVGTVPVAPSGLVVDKMVGNLVTFRWTSAGFGPTPTDFVIEGGTAPGQVQAGLATGSVTPMFTVEIPTGAFYVRVHAVNGNIRSTGSNEIRLFVNVPVVPSAPAHLLGLVNGSTLSLVWTNTFSGGEPTSLVLDVVGTVTTSLLLSVQDTFSLADVPPGTYTVTLRAHNAAGPGPPSNAVTLTFPGPCSGPPMVPGDVRVSAVGRRLDVAWAPGTSGPAPTLYGVIVIGEASTGVITPARSVSGTVAPGSYTLSVVAANACGVSAGTAPQTIVVRPIGTSATTSPQESAVTSTPAAGSLRGAAALDGR